MAIDPLQRKCICGHSTKFSKLVYVKMLLFGKYRWRCPQCQRVHDYIMVYHSVEVFSESRNENKEMVEGKKEMYKKC